MKLQTKKKKIPLKAVLLPLLCLAVVFTVIFITVRETREETESNREMAPATFPVIRILTDDIYETSLHGYASEMKPQKMRDEIVPLKSERIMKLRVYSFGNALNRLHYEVRSLDSEDFIDQGDVSDFTLDREYTEIELRLSDLLTAGNEYQVRFTLLTAERSVYYYVRILYGKSIYSEELLGFSREFSEACFHPETEQKIIVNNIQPDDSGRTDTYGITDLQSKYAYFIFGGNKTERTTETLYRISELSPTQCSVTLCYNMSMELSEVRKDYEVREFFVVRYRSGKIYLLDYKRTLEQIFDAEKAMSEKGRIQLGIHASDPSVLHSENDHYTAFIVNRELWCYQSQSNAMNLIFSFHAADDSSGRTENDHHQIQVVKVTDDGIIDYMVYGYMNRGIYEGEVGICFYRYRPAENASERLFYMPVLESEQILMSDLGTLAYVNDSDVCYIRYGDTIYSVDLHSGESVQVSLSVYPGAYGLNSRGNVVAWQEGAEPLYPERLVILNMDTQTTTVVPAPEDSYIKILGFAGDDIIYGFGKREDSLVLANMDVEQLLKQLVISETGERKTIMKQYDAGEFFIRSCQVYDTRVAIQRVRKTANNTLRVLEDEVLLLTQDINGSEKKSMLAYKTSEPELLSVYIQLGIASGADSQYSEAAPRFETGKSVNEIKLLERSAEVYYVYANGSLYSTESDMKTAISKAYAEFGVVISNELRTIWTRGTRDLIKTLSYQPVPAKTENDTLQSCLHILAAESGIQLPDVSEELKKGHSPIGILDENIGDGSGINLYGCSLSEVLYFVDEGHPVILVTGDFEAKLLVGYTQNSVRVYEPFTDEETEIPMNDAIAGFDESGNVFITCR